MVVPTTGYTTVRTRYPFTAVAWARIFLFRSRHINGYHFPNTGVDKPTFQEHAFSEGRLSWLAVAVDIDVRG